MFFFRSLFSDREQERERDGMPNQDISAVHLTNAMKMGGGGLTAVGTHSQVLWAHVAGTSPVGPFYRFSLNVEKDPPVNE